MHFNLVFILFVFKIYFIEFLFSSSDLGSINMPFACRACVRHVRDMLHMCPSPFFLLRNDWTCQRHVGDTVSVWIGIIIASNVCVLLPFFLFSFFFLHAFQLLETSFAIYALFITVHALFTHCSCIVHGTHNYFIKKIY